MNPTWIQEIEKRIDEIKKEIEKAKAESKWTPKENESFYWVNNICEINQECLTNYDEIESITRYTKVFKTYGEAVRYANYLQARYEYSYEFTREEWEDSELKKYYIYYDEELKELDTGSYYTIHKMNKAFFKTEEKAKEFIKKYRKEILEFEFGIKEE